MGSIAIPEDEKCCKCKRKATMWLQGYNPMCTFHYNRLVKELRIKRKLNKRRK